ncbi:hypothetical protein AKO1_013077 [Acrasis kona]|uniref:N-acyl phosphatidylethanolamine phospholipase D n=1 Tax=Acrasis kona TaxID=1008807 RepID=A0AAW2YZK9_9EUKA
MGNNSSQPTVEQMVVNEATHMMPPDQIVQDHPDATVIAHPINTVYPKHFNFEDNTFKNPDVTIAQPPMTDQIRIYSEIMMARQFVPNEHQLRTMKPNWEAIHSPNHNNIQYTWLGHSSFFVQVGGFNVLTDPVFRQRCSFFQHLIGPKRLRPVPMTVDELPPIDVVVISHNHTDHLDLQAVKDLVRVNKQNMKLYVPLRMKAWLHKNVEELSNEQCIEMDWWQSIQHTFRPNVVPHPHSVGEQTASGVLDITFLPSQHWSVRNLFDTNYQLWGGFGFTYTPNNTTFPKRVFYFAGDTGYNNYLFKEIRTRFSDPNGGIDVAFLPIGAYGPRWFSASQHTDPVEAVQVAQDINARHSCGCHFGTFVVSTEPVLEPIEKLHQVLQLMKLDYQQYQPWNEHGDNFFVTVCHGETYLCKHKTIADNANVLEGANKDQNTAVILQTEREKLI